MKIIVPDSWEELTDYQQEEIIHIINNTEDKDFTEQYLKIVQILLMPKNNIWYYFKMRWALRKVSIVNFQEAVQFLYEKPRLYHFPEIKKLIKPADRMGDLSIEQFSLCDTLYYRYRTEKKEIYLRQLVAALYRKNIGFDKNILPQIAEITDKLSLKQAERIGFIFGAIRDYIANSYPSIFVSGDDKRKDENRPVFEAKSKYTPFSKIIVMVAADELRLLGNLKQCQETPIYDFMNALIESKRIHEMKNAK